MTNREKILHGIYHVQIPTSRSKKEPLDHIWFQLDQQMKDAENHSKQNLRPTSSNFLHASTVQERIFIPININFWNHNLPFLASVNFSTHQKRKKCFSFLRKKYISSITCQTHSIIDSTCTKTNKKKGKSRCHIPALGQGTWQQCPSIPPAAPLQQISHQKYRWKPRNKGKGNKKEIYFYKIKEEKNKKKEEE